MIIALAVWGTAMALICFTLGVACRRRDRAERQALRMQPPVALRRVRRPEGGRRAVVNF